MFFLTNKPQYDNHISLKANIGVNYPIVEVGTVWFLGEGKTRVTGH